MKIMQIIIFHALRNGIECGTLSLAQCVEVKIMNIAEIITELRESVGENRTEF